MNNNNQPAFPVDDLNVTRWIGITKREYFAGLAMQGLLACNEEDTEYDVQVVARNAVTQADALLTALEGK